MLTERLMRLVEVKIGKSKKFKKLEELTEITADRWSAVSLDRQKPTLEMAEKLCKEWPEFAVWLMTGMSPNNVGKQTTPDRWEAMNSDYSLKKLLKVEPVKLSEKEALFLDQIAWEGTNEIEGFENASNRVRFHCEVRNANESFESVCKKKIEELEAEIGKAETADGNLILEKAELESYLRHWKSAR